jgi:hypothetical protein
MQTLTKDPTLAPSIPAAKISKIRSAKSGVIEAKFKIGLRNTEFSHNFYNLILEPHLCGFSQKWEGTEGISPQRHREHEAKRSWEFCLVASKGLPNPNPTPTRPVNGERGTVNG